MQLSDATAAAIRVGNVHRLRAITTCLGSNLKRELSSVIVSLKLMVGSGVLVFATFSHFRFLQLVRSQLTIGKARQGTAHPEPEPEPSGNDYSHELLKERRVLSFSLSSKRASVFVWQFWGVKLLFFQVSSFLFKETRFATQKRVGSRTSQERKRVEIENECATRPGPGQQTDRPADRRIGAKSKLLVLLLSTHRLKQTHEIVLFWFNIFGKYGTFFPSPSLLKSE